MILFLKIYFKNIILFILIFLLLKIVVIDKIDYWEMIWINRYKKDYIKWILSDKYYSKNFAKSIGFNVAETYLVVNKIDKLDNFNKINYVIKPSDLCDSCGVFLMRNNINILDKKKYTLDTIKKKLKSIRKKIGNSQEYYMHEEMYGHIPPKRYIVEELLLDNNNLPNDYKCYTFNGRIFLIAVTYNRKIDNKGNQTFDSLWLTRDWIPIPFKMIKKNYKFNIIPKPKGFNKMIKLVEHASSILDRHCRIDVFLVNGECYFGEFTFFGGAFLHTRICNFILGLKWKINEDKKSNDKLILKKINKILST